jgi:hypothetical protein
MNTNAVLVALTSMSLGATCYLIASLPKESGDDRVADLTKRLDAAEKRADAVESLRGEVRQMHEALDRRVGDVARRVDAATAAASAPADAAAGAQAARGAPGAPRLEDLVADRVEKKLSEKMETLAARDRERGEDGKWKAPLDELGTELKLTDAQKAEAKRIFEHSRDDVFALVKTQRLDGGCILDDYAAMLKSGADPGESTRQFIQRLFTERVPGSDRTYLADFITIGQDVEEQLGRQFDKEQMRRFKALRVDLLDVKTGYDPVGDYVRAKLQ